MKEISQKIQRIINHFGSKTGRLIVINTVGTYLNIAFALFFVLLLTRTMGRVEYGVMTILLNISYILANILEFGTTATIYSYIPGMHAKYERRQELLGFIKTTIFYQSGLSFIVILLLIIAFPTLDTHFFKTHAGVPTLTITAISVLCFIWQNTLLNMFFAMKKFMEANVWLNISNVIKTAVIILLFPLHLVSLGSVIFVFGVVGPLIFIGIAAWYYRSDVGEILGDVKTSRDQLKIQYTLTNFVASQFFNVGMRMDLFILSFYGLRNQVADYGLAQKVMLTIISTVVSITQVLSPKYALVKTRQQAKQIMKQSLLYLMLPTLCFAVLLFLPDSVFHLIFTAKFEETPMLTRLLGLAYIIFSIGQVFALFYLYTFKKPQMLLYSNIAFFLVMTVGCFVLVPHLKAYAGPLLLAIGLLITTGTQGIGYLREVRKLPEGGTSR
jgi:O-antigen/teichoic acid export membrane protein